MEKNLHTKIKTQQTLANNYDSIDYLYNSKPPHNQLYFFLLWQAKIRF